MIILAFVSGALYICVIASLFYGWIRLKPFISHQNASSLRISVIIPVRNESANLSALINCLVEQHYPSELTEIIIIDDHSSDQSFEIASSLLQKRGTILQLPANKSGKKAALWEGLSLSSGDLLITTDADCICSPYWIQTIAEYYITHNPSLILAPVIGKAPVNFFESLQQLEIISLLGSTAGAASINRPIMCNGANLAFPRTLLKDLQAIYNNRNVVSGDDMFVLEYVKKRFPNGVHFIKSVNATIYTRLSGNLKHFIHQRRRWASKARFYNDSDIIISALAVLQINIVLLSFLIIAVITSNYTFFLLLLGLKSIIDFPFLWSVTRFFKMTKRMYWFPLLQCIYFFYVSFTFLGSFTGNFNWKSRKLST